MANKTSSYSWQAEDHSRLFCSHNGNLDTKLGFFIHLCLYHFKSSWVFQENAKYFSMLYLWKTASTLLFTGTNNMSPFVSTQHLFYISTLSYWLFCDYIRSLVLPHSVDSFFCNMFWHTKWTYWISLYLVLQDSFSPQQLRVCLTAPALFFFPFFRSFLALMFFTPSDRAVSGSTELPRIKACSLCVSPFTTNNPYQKCPTLSKAPSQLLHDFPNS